jgi:HSP20 family protein
MNNKIKIEETKDLIPKENSKEGNQEEGEVAIDFCETPSDFILLAALGGIELKNLEVSIENNILIIKGFRENPLKEKDKNYLLKECFWGPFSRKIILPEEADISKTEAFFQKGLLKIKIPKIIKIKQKKLEIKGE